MEFQFGDGQAVLVGPVAVHRKRAAVHASADRSTPRHLPQSFPHSIARQNLELFSTMLRWDIIGLLQPSVNPGNPTMKRMQISKAFAFMESGPVVLVTTNDGQKNNIMTISWTMVVDFTPVLAITTGPWNYSYAALTGSKECVIAIVTVDLIDQAVGVGTCSGSDIDKFKKFGFTPMAGKHVGSPLIKECLANIECKVVDIIDKYHIVVLEGVAAYVDSDRREKRVLHAIGDGTFVVDGRRLDRRKMMRSKLPDGI